MSSIEALWSVDFQSNAGLAGYGVVVFETGRVMGGDSSMIYLGQYRVNNGRISAKVQISKYVNVDDAGSVVGLDNFHLIIESPLNLENSPNQMSFDGHVEEDPTRKIQINFVRRAELP